jgi:ATP-dependent DNA helicase RecG
MNVQETPAPISSIRYIKGIGPKRALALEKLGIHSMRDLLYLFPRRYEDRSSFRTIAQIRPGEFATVRGEVITVKLKRIRRMTIFEMMVGDATGMVHAVWFNQPYLKNNFAQGQQVILYGRIDLYQNRLQISSPEYEIISAGSLNFEGEPELPEEKIIHTGRITPIYPLTEGLFQRSLRAILYDVVHYQLEKGASEWLPESFCSSKKLMGLCQALREMHFPTSHEQYAEARRRIVFDEFFLFELTLAKKIQALKEQYKSHPLQNGASLAKEFCAKLPFKLTASQEKAVADLAEDLARSYPMNRLLQGDVGSGKTLVSAFGLVVAAKSEKQAAMLVPTEILAEQHYRTLAPVLESLGVTVGLLTSSTPAPKRERLVAELKQGKIAALIGTHAILSEDVQFKSLALVVIDEQHKFGVHQRYQLLNKDPRPHQLVMTATPIPRTLALTIYGDLDISIMKELPAGRQPIKTYWITRQKQTEVLQHILRKINEGDQAYFIFPLIEETEKSDLLAAKREFKKLQEGIFEKVPMGLVHGKVPNAERDALMRGFARGEIKVLVATSVIEVGVNNPNATIMVIENAERFGLSQLHQMRGRIGRGEKSSECFLFGEPKTTEGQKRLRILTKTQDGFLIAEEDLKLRGPGDFWGTKQSGDAFFRVANPLLDQDLLLEARDTALMLERTHRLETDPDWAETKKYLEQNPIKY